ncbi:ABC transporter substrate-binding protein [Candidatus Calescamantes bacterium]|nr:ABC transporter substrate-binding protein [Candidatus Calescamantes bacterium]MCK5599513.1 ABC transporter substrate-binding protein [bacterium]
MKKLALICILIFGVLGYSSGIVSLAPNITRMLIDLGLKEQIIGTVSSGNTFAANVGTFAIPELEEVLRLKPRLVFYTGIIQEPLGKKLKDLGLEGKRIYISSAEELRSAYMELGSITDTETKAHQIILQIDRTLSAFKIGSPLKVILLLWSRPYYSCGPETFIGELISVSGMENVSQVSKGRYAIISAETLIRSRPDIIIICAEDHDAVRNLLLKDPVIKGSGLIDNLRIIVIEEAAKVLQPSLDALEVWEKLLNEI